MNRYEVRIAPVALGVVAVEASPQGLARVADALGAPLPPTARSVATGQGLLFRSGPESLLVLGLEGGGKPLAERLERAAGEPSAIVADLGDGHAFYEVAGPDALDVLSQGVAIDLREGALAPGQAARTLCFGVEAILVRDRIDAVRVGCRASHGEYLAARLRLAGDPRGEGA